VQSDLKRLLAYSGIAHAGTILLVAAGTIARPDLHAEATSAALFYMAAYVFTAGGAFGLLSWLEADGQVYTRISSLRGLARTRPGVAATLSLFLLSLGGIPATGGFLGKWLVFSVAVKADMIGLTIVGVLLSVVALGYYLRVIVAMYMEPAPEELAPPMTQRNWATFAASFCAAMVVLLGVLPGAFLGRVF
jgi:NADH-quinone oxidoreductase subunit N